MFSTMFPSSTQNCWAWPKSLINNYNFIQFYKCPIATFILKMKNLTPCVLLLLNPIHEKLYLKGNRKNTNMIKNVHIINNQYCLQLLPMYHDLQTQVLYTQSEVNCICIDLYSNCIKLFFPSPSFLQKQMLQKRNPVRPSWGVNITVCFRCFSYWIF